MREIFIAYRLVWFRVSCYFLIPFIITFLSLTESWSGTTWHETHWFLIVRILLASALAGITSLVAFIDQSMEKANERHKQLSTKFTYQPDPAKDTPTP